MSPGRSPLRFKSAVFAFLQHKALLFLLHFKGNGNQPRTQLYSSLSISNHKAPSWHVYCSSVEAFYSYEVGSMEVASLTFENHQRVYWGLFLRPWTEMLEGNLAWTEWQQGSGWSSQLWATLHKPFPVFKKDIREGCSYIAPGEPQWTVVQISYNCITWFPLVPCFLLSHVAAYCLDRSKTLLFPHSTENTKNPRTSGLRRTKSWEKSQLSNASSIKHAIIGDVKRLHSIETSM